METTGTKEESKIFYCIYIHGIQHSFWSTHCRRVWQQYWHHRHCDWLTPCRRKQCLAWLHGEHVRIDCFWRIKLHWFAWWTYAEKDWTPPCNLILASWRIRSEPIREESWKWRTDQKSNGHDWRYNRSKRKRQSAFDWSWRNGVHSCLIHFNTLNNAFNLIRWERKQVFSRWRILKWYRLLFQYHDNSNFLAICVYLCRI